MAPQPAGDRGTDAPQHETRSSGDLRAHLSEINAVHAENERLARENAELLELLRRSTRKLEPMFVE